jgi:hypothetical protein
VIASSVERIPLYRCSGGVQEPDCHLRGRLACSRVYGRARAGATAEVYNGKL